MLKAENAILVIIDVQGNLARVVADSINSIQAITRLVKGAQAFEIPILLTAQAPQKIGHTIQEIKGLLPDIKEHSRTFFSIWLEPSLQEAIKQSCRSQVILCGFETHICLYQSAMDLVEAGFDVFIMTDAASSRDIQNKVTALHEMVNQGVHLTSLEMAFFAMLRSADHPNFKTISSLIK